MATKVRGITIELGADVSGIEKGLKSVNNSLYDTQARLRDVERLLKLDPQNVELLAQKEKLLNDQLDNQNKKLKILKDAQKNFNKEQYESEEAADKAYDAITREIASTEISIKKLTESQEGFNDALDQSGPKLEAVGNTAQKVADKTEALSRAAQGLLAGAAAASVASVKAYSDFEQLIGGVETFYKDSAGVVRKYAEEAYKTAGLSANEYLDNVTGFSAALLNSLGGNTRAAAELANIAIIDMADNANKFGTDIESIQSAYQGFAKQNYNMLDNLKLGFAGNKAGMQDLLAEAERLTGVQFDISNFSDIVMAIHEVQSSMGIAGTTAKEAETTISGSIHKLKAAVENLTLGFAQADADVEKLTTDVEEAFAQVLSNVLPIVETILSHLPDWAQFLLVITAIIAAISPVASLIANITTTAMALKPVMTALSADLAAMNPLWIALIAALGTTIALAVKIKEAWGDMNEMEKIASILELIAAAAFTAAIAIAAFNSAATGGIAAAGIVAGIAAVTAAIFELQGKSSQNGFDAKYITNNDMPFMANGGSLYAGSAIVGEAGAELLTIENGHAVVQPLASDSPTAAPVVQASGEMMRPVDVTLLLDSATLARMMVLPNARAQSLAGESAVR